MASDPLVEQRIRSIQARAAERRAKRDEAAAKQADREKKSQEFYAAQDEETRQSVSPNGLTAQQRHTEAINYHAAIHEAKCREEDIAEMAKIKDEWFLKSTTPNRKSQIVTRYAALHRRYVPGTTPEMVNESWEREKKQALLQKVFEAAR